MTGIHATQSPVYRPGTRTATEQPEGSEDWMQALLSAMGGTVESVTAEGKPVFPEASFPQSQGVSDGKDGPQGWAQDEYAFLGQDPLQKNEWQKNEKVEIQWTEVSFSPETQLFTAKNVDSFSYLSPLDFLMYTDASLEELDEGEANPSLEFPLIFPALTPATPLTSADVTTRGSSQEGDPFFTAQMASQEKMSPPSFGTIRHSTTQSGTTRVEDSGVLDGFQAEAPLDLTSKSKQEADRQQGNLFIQAESSPADPSLKHSLQDMLFQAHFQDHLVDHWVNTQANTQANTLADTQAESFLLKGSTADQVMEKIPSAWISQLHASERNVQKEIRLQLHPEELGAVEVQMVFDEQGDLKVVLSAEKEATKDLLERGSQQLQEWLNQIGHEKASLSFSFQDAPKHPDSDHHARSAPSGPQGLEESSLNDTPNDSPRSQPASQSLLGLMDVTL